MGGFIISEGVKGKLHPANSTDVIKIAIPVINLFFIYIVPFAQINQIISHMDNINGNKKVTNYI